MPDKKRVLLVDDDSDFVEAVASFLEANGLAVSRARNGAEGIKLAKMEHPDLILMDIMMNERTEGFFTIHEMRLDPALKDVPIFVVSSLARRVPELEIPAGGGWLAHDMFFEKPVDLARLLDGIRQRVYPAA